MKLSSLRGRFSRKTLVSIVIACVGTLAIALLVVNAASSEKKIQQKVERLYSAEDPEFVHVMGVLLGPPVLNGNCYRVLVNGDRIFPAMLAAIRAATQTIAFETCIYWSGAIGKEFAAALSERARAGVKVHVLLDWVGSAKMDAALVDELKSAGVQIQKFHPPHWSHLGRLNTAGAVLHGAEYFPKIEPLAGGAAQVFSSSPSGGSASMELMYLMSITSAKRTIRLSSSYFVPNELAVKTMVEALKRGVKVQIITPGKYIDAETVRAASRARWGDLLAAGAEMYEYQPTMYHCKVMIVDEFMVSTGSTNFDDRSFRLYDEANLNIYDAGSAKEQVAIFTADLGRSRRITHAEWQARPLRAKVLEHLASMFGSQL